MNGRRRNPRWLERPAIALATLAMIASLASCDGQEQKTDYPRQSSLELVSDNPGHHVVTLTPLGASQIGVRTEPVRQSGKFLVLPYDALLYGADGTTFVYTSPEALTFLYEEITLEKIVGEQIYFSKGPAVGTQVVTHAVAQVHGADIQLEFGDIA